MIRDVTAEAIASGQAFILVGVEPPGRFIPAMRKATQVAQAINEAGAAKKSEE